MHIPLPEPPYRLKALRYIKYGDFEMSEGSWADVSLERDKTSAMPHRMLRLTSGSAQTTFTEAALQNAVDSGDFDFR